MTEPLVVYLSDQTPHAVFCGACKSHAWALTHFGGGPSALDSAKAAAESCCAPRICKDCGREFEKHSWGCADCVPKKERIKLHEKFKKATKFFLSDYAGKYVSDGEELYIESADVDEEDERIFELDDGTRFLWGTYVEKPAVDLERACSEDWLQEHHEDAFDHVDLKKLAQAQVLVNEAIASVETYYADEKIVVIIAMPKPQSAIAPDDAGPIDIAT